MSERCGFSTTSSVRMAISFAAAVVLGSFVAPSVLAAVALPALPIRPTASQTVPTSPAEVFAQQNIDKGYSILNSKAAPAQRHMQFRDFMLGLIDGRRLGLFTLGQFANSASKADIDAFIAAFADYTVAVYETRLDKYKGQILKVTGSSARAADDVVVNCEATDPAHPSDPSTKVAFRIRKGADGKFIVTDLNIEGIWQTISQRADFTGFLQQHGGRVSDLTNDLKRQTQSLYASA